MRAGRCVFCIRLIQCGLPDDVLLDVFRIAAIYCRPHPEGLLRGGNLAVRYGHLFTIGKKDCHVSLGLLTILPNTVYPFLGC